MTHSRSRPATVGDCAPRIRPTTPEREARAILASDPAPSLAAFAGLALGLPGARQPFAHPAGPATPSAPRPGTATLGLPPAPPGDADGGAGPWGPERPERPSTPRGPRLHGLWWLAALLVGGPALWALLILAGRAILP